jgi:lipoprotein-anchoring transpeptidase ErfK/SrfK
MKILITVIASFFASITVSFAACTQPSGTYVGSGNGFSYQGGNFYSAISDSMVATIASNGSATIDEIGKNINARFAQVSTLPAIGTANHVFNKTTCRGIVTSSLGLTYAYTVSGSGNVITFTYYNNDNIIATFSIRLEKV